MEDKQNIHQVANKLLVSHFSSLVDVENGSAVSTYRKHHKKKAHLLVLVLSWLKIIITFQSALTEEQGGLYQKG